TSSLGDVFATLVKQYVLKQTAAQADWLLGAGLFTPAVHGIAIRSMAAPGSAYDDPVLGKDPQPGHMQDYARVTYDNGGAHINSGIPSRAFYLLAVTLTGYAWERAGRIWYAAMQDDQLNPKAQFRDFAQITVWCARRLYGEKSVEAQATKTAWGLVGIKA
ncbi:MAG: peptidase M4 family protein, partial [Anaerolineae bacterium]|nr:peptidase M4 family protein [Anaerolineae bacterium]